MKPISQWDQSFKNFLGYLSEDFGHWIVVYEGSFQSEIVSQLKNRLKSAEFFDLEKEDPQVIRDVGNSNCGNDRAGFLEFVIRYPASVYGGSSPGAEGLDVFIYWPQSRVRLCFDVTDNNFHQLFSETPEQVSERCVRLRNRVAETGALIYSSGDDTDERLKINCAGSEWSAYTGFGQTFDYVLPSGEVSCLPQSVDGVLQVQGWIVGTIPFGVKYGRIEKGDLELRFEGRKIVGVSGMNKNLCTDFEGALSNAPRLQIVSEAGIGQSLGVSKAAANHKVGYSWHERHFGLHLGLGAELPKEDMSNNSQTSGHHLDIVLSKGRIEESNGKEFLKW